MMGSLDRAVALLDRKTQAPKPTQRAVHRPLPVKQERPARAEKLDFSLGSRLDDETLKALRAVASKDGHNGLGCVEKEHHQ
jgi:hypothetical protein